MDYFVLENLYAIGFLLTCSDFRYGLSGFAKAKIESSAKYGSHYILRRTELLDNLIGF